MKLYHDEHLMAREEFSQTTPVCDYLVYAMKAAPADDVDLQYQCGGVIEALTCQHNGNKTAFHQNGAVTLVVKAMQAFATHEKMQRYGCGALCNLSSLHSHQQNVVDAGGIDAILAAMRQFPESEDIQKFAAYGLCHLVWVSESNKKIIISKGGAIALAQAQHRFFGQGSQVEEAATQALKRLHA